MRAGGAHRRWAAGLALALLLGGCIGTVPVEKGEDALPYDPLLLTKREIRRDKRILKQARRIFKELRRVHKFDLDANVHNGVVLLTGEVPMRTFDLDQLVQRLSELEGVQVVHDHATSGGGEHIGTRIADGWLQVQVKAAITTSDPVLGRRLKIICREQWVFVMGLAYESELSGIVQAIKGVPNIRRIHLLMETVPGKPGPALAPPMELPPLDGG